eukprot:scaffold50476_cov63-Phaeocystis_antarctica.AAC.2
MFPPWYVAPAPRDCPVPCAHTAWQLSGEMCRSAWNGRTGERADGDRLLLSSRALQHSTLRDPVPARPYPRVPQVACVRRSAEWHGDHLVKASPLAVRTEARVELRHHSGEYGGEMERWRAVVSGGGERRRRAGGGV